MARRDKRNIGKIMRVRKTEVVRTSQQGITHKHYQDDFAKGALKEIAIRAEICLPPSILFLAIVMNRSGLPEVYEGRREQLECARNTPSPCHMKPWNAVSALNGVVGEIRKRYCQ